MLYFYQHLPQLVNPIAISVGIISIRWYSLMYLVGFITVYAILSWRIKKESVLPLSLTKDTILDLLLYSFLGLLIGARLGYVLFYNLPYFIYNPLAIISPYDFNTGEFIGIYGMSYHGGLIGVITAAVWFALARRLNFWKLADFVIPAIPAGYFWGRIGNFFNGELYGKATAHWWGMYFDSERFLRHPSQLYEAFLEGVLLFVFLWAFRHRSKFTGHLLCLYLAGYGIVRFLAEFFRDQSGEILLFNWLSIGQLLSIFMIAASAVIYLIGRRSHLPEA